MEWLNFISTEIHKSLGPLFDRSISDELRQRQIGLLGKRFGYVNERLTARDHLMGEKFTAADAYLFTVLSWTPSLKIDTSRWPALQGFVKRVGSRASVQAAMKAEGLTK